MVLSVYEYGERERAYKVIVSHLIFSTISLFNVLLRFRVARQQRWNTYVGIGTRI